MKHKLIYSLLLVSSATYAGGKHEQPRNPLQPSYYVSNDVSNDNRSDADATATASGGQSNSVSNATGGSGGAGGVASANVNASGGSGGAGGSGGMGGSGGSVGGVNVENNLRYEQRRIPVNTAYAAGLTSSGEDTCLGSISGGAQHAVFGISIGKTVTDANCVKLKRSKMLASLGEPEAALTLWCDEPDMVRALNLAGIYCDALGNARYVRMRAAEEAAAPAPAVVVPSVVTPVPTPAPQCRKAVKKRKLLCKQ